MSARTQHVDKSKQKALLQQFFQSMQSGGAQESALSDVLTAMAEPKVEPEEEPRRKPKIVAADFAPEEEEPEEPEEEPQFTSEEGMSRAPDPQTRRRVTLALGKPYPGAGEFVQGMIKRGWSPQEAAGVAGNAHVESGFRPGIKSSMPGENSFGLLQWNGARLQGLQNMAAIQGRNWQDPEVQMDYIHAERTGDSVKFGGGNESGMYKKALAPGGSAADIAERFGRFVERPQRLADTVDVRRQMAEQYFKGIT